jgi:tRNA threonylcarbamoyl adenosine modification protein YeaZ
MKLLIDTSDSQKTIVGLDGKILEKESGPDKSQQVLSLIDKILKENRKILRDITEIEVNLGPGSFTGLKIGAAVANALGFALDVPVNGKRQVALPHFTSK